MSKTIQRLLTFFIGVPFFVAVTWYFTFNNHLILNIFVLLASLLGAYEIHTLLKNKFEVQPLPLILALSLIISATGIFCCLCGKDFEFLTYSFILCFLLILVSEVFVTHSKGDDPFSGSLSRIVTSLFTLLYVPFLLSFIQRMCVFEHSKENITLFLVMVFMCDSIAWLFGITMGKNNRGIVKASPNKSIAGFIGGFIGALLSGLLFWFFLPQIFTGSVLKIILLSVITAFASIVGDLTESVVKRSAAIKDSGRLIPGRGGLMDSIDSIVMAAPIYFIVSNILYNFK